MQVAPSDDQMGNECKWRDLVTKFWTDASGAIWWPNLKLMQICNQGKWRHLVGKFGTNAVSATWWSKLEPIECWIFLSTEFACFVAGEISQVIEAMPGSVVPLAMFILSFYFHTRSLFSITCEPGIGGSCPSTSFWPSWMGGDVWVKVKVLSSLSFLVVFYCQCLIRSCDESTRE